MNNKGNGGILLIIGFALIISAIIAVLITVNYTFNHPAIPDMAYTIGWSVLGYLIALLLGAIGGVFVAFGLRSS